MFKMRAVGTAKVIVIVIAQKVHSEGVKEWMGVGRGGGDMPP